MTLDQQIGRWRGHVERHRAISAHDVDEMEAHLREQVDDLVAVGLDDDEAFLVAVKRIGSLDAVSREFAQEHTERLWKQLVTSAAATPRPNPDLGVAIGLAVGAALVVRLAIALLSPERAALNAALLVLPFLTAYFAWKRRLSPVAIAAAATSYAGAALLLNLYPFDVDGTTGPLAAAHSAVALWLLGVGTAYVAGRWRSDRRRMDFIRFTGEITVYYALLALGGGVLVGLSAGAFTAAGIDIDEVVVQTVLPCGAAGAVLIAAWLVEAKQSVIENIAPVLTKVFTPLTVVMLVAVAGAFVASPGVLRVDRELLLVMDLILVLVVGLVLYALSARDRGEPPGWFDALQLGLIVLALLVDALVAIAMVGRVAEWGWSANKVTALGLNLVLLVNLVWSARLTWGFLGHRRGLVVLERWQTSYLPVYALWAVAVAVVVPPVFGFS
ncbi:hypothetical protein GCM10027062_15650 [Nocardioides hungaricus]